MNLVSELTPGRFDALLVQAMLGATVLLFCAMMAVVVTGPRSAAIRHRIWTLSVLSALTFPGFALILPNLGPKWPHASATTGMLAEVYETSEPFAAWSGTLVQTDAAEERIDGETVVVGRVMSRASIATNRDSTSVSSQEKKGANLAPNQDEGFALLFVPIAFWLTGVIIGLLALAKSQRSATGLVRRAIPVTNRDTLEIAEQLCKSAGIRGGVSILLSSEVTVPMTLGYLRPVVVLPSGYGLWSVEKCRAVLAHELAHIRRRDVLSQQIAQFACAIYWCQPLVWFANWRMRVEREFACDDAALRMGESPREYAGHLLEVASAVCGQSLSPNCVVAIASTGGLEHRIRAILNPCLNRRPVGPGTGRMLAAAALALVVVLCLLSPAGSTKVDLADSASAAAPAEQSETLMQAVDDALESALKHTPALESEGENVVVDGGWHVVLRFPPDRAIGVISIQDHDKDIGKDPARWGDARGNVRVPIGARVRLDISAAGRNDLSPLRQLSPNSLDMLSIREAKLDDAALESISHLAGLRSIRLYCCRIEDAGARHLAKLSDLEVLDLTGSWTSDLVLAQLDSLEKLVELNLGWTKTITDRGVRHLTKLESLRSLNLERTQVTDSGLASLKDLVSLRSLNLRSTRLITGAGMSHLSNLTSLQDLDLSRYPWDSGQPIGDQGLAQLVNLRELRRLVLSGTALTDAGLVDLQSFTHLEELWLPSGPSEVGLKTIGTLTSLRKLGVSTTMASDLGVSHLSGLENLEFLNLWCDESRITDRAVTHLQKMTSLKTLRLLRSGITDSGLRSLAQLRSLEELELRGNRITFEGLKHLREFPSLRNLSLSGLKGRSGTLRHLKVLPRLRSLQIGKSTQLGVDGVGTDTADEGLAYLSGMKDLERLSLSSITVTDEGIKHIGGLTSLKVLDLANGQNSFTDAGLECLADLKKLEELVIRGSITDRGLVHLSGLESLRKSIVSGTVSDAAIEKLSDSLPSMNKVYNF